MKPSRIFSFSFLFVIAIQIFFGTTFTNVARLVIMLEKIDPSLHSVKIQLVSPEKKQEIREWQKGDNKIEFFLAREGTYTVRIQAVSLDGETNLMLTTLHVIQGKRFLITVSPGKSLSIDEASLEQRVPRDGLVAEYLFDGNADDTSGNQNHGELRAPKWYSPPFLTNGRKEVPKTAYYFPGREEINVMGPYIDCGNGPSITNIQDKLTVSLWIKPSVLRTRNLQIIGRQSNPLLGGWGIWINMDGKLLFNLSKDGETVELWNDKVQLTTNRFYHIVAMYDRKKGVASVYINNKKQTWENLFYSLTYPLTPNRIVFHEDHLMIGGFWGCGISYFEGIIDDVRIYNRILTDEEVEALYRE